MRACNHLHVCIRPCTTLVVDMCDVACFFNIYTGLLVVEDNPWIEANNPYKKLPTVRTVLMIITTV
jgi:hypothetical protein